MDSITIDFPLRGEWQFLRPPGHHPFAFDFVKKDDKRQRYHPRSKWNVLFGQVPCKDYYCWDQPVYAPVTGKVIKVGTDWHDHEATNLWRTIAIWYIATYKFKPQTIKGHLDIRPNAGNYVMIQTSEGFIVFLAHLKKDSVGVSKNQIVTAGECIGHVGNSGNSTAPHLHLNLFDQMYNPLQAKVLPFVFTAFEELNTNSWISKKHAVPSLKSFIRVK